VRLAPFAFLAALASLAACAGPTRGLSPELHYVADTPDGGVVQASSEAVADEQMRVRCPGGYEIDKVEEVSVASGDDARATERRFTYRCVVFQFRTSASR
jgi:hypothetical protein